MKIIKNGVEVNVNNGSGKSLQDRMIANGWVMKLGTSCDESAQELYDRLNSTGYYKDIKVYYTTTQIRGIYSYFAFVKYR